MVGWHHWLNRHQFEQDPGIGIGQGSLACCILWGHKESYTERLNWTELNCLSEWLFPPLSLSLWAFLFLDTHNIEFRPVNKPTMPFKCLSEMTSNIFLTLNQNEEMTKLSEEDVSKPETD